MAGGVPAGRLGIEIYAEIARLQADLDKAKRAVKAASKQIADDAKHANDNLGNMGSGLRSANDNLSRFGGTSRLASHHVQNLAFQFQDMAIGLQGGQKPLTVFLQQGSQIAGVMAQAGIGVGGLVRQIGSMVLGFAAAHPILLAVGAGIGVASVAFKGFTDILENKAPVEDYIKTLGLTDEEAKKLTDTHVTLGDTAKAAWDTIKEALGLEDVFSTLKGWVSDAAKWLYDQFKNATASVYGAFKATYDNIGYIWENLPALVGDAMRYAVNVSIERLQFLVNAGIIALNAMADKANDVFGTDFGHLNKIDLGGLKLQYSAAGQELGARFQSSYNAARSEAMAAFGRFEDRVIANRNARLLAQAKELIDKRKDAATKAAKDTADKEKEVWDFLAEWQTGLLSSVEKQLEANQAADWKEFTDALANDGRFAWEENERAAMDAKRAADAYADSIGNLIGMLGNLGSMGQGIGALLGVFNGQTSAIGGPIGELLNMGTGQTRYDDRLNREVAITIGDEVSKIFKANGDFAKTFSGILQSAGTGMIAGSAVFGKQSSSEKVGSAIGGVLGKEAGKALGKVVGGTLGKALGPLGSIAGGILGSVIGGLFKSVKWGRVDLSSQGVSATQGNSDSSERAALAAGNSIFGSLTDIADAFGGTVGDFGSISVGVRHGDYRVNTGGTSLKKKNGAVDFDQDAEAAIAYAIQEAIKRGAIDGIRASTQNLLKSSDDLQKNLEKALSFENVFKQLESLRDPLGYALDELQTEFDRLRKIFDEAGASAQEYADLEELLARKRQEIIDDQAQKAIDDLADRNSLEVQILQMLGRSEEAVSLARLQELAAMKESLRPLQEMVYQLEDAQAIIDKFGPLADDLRAFKQELLGGDGIANSFAYLTAKFRDTAALAKAGNAEALANLRGDAGAYLEAAKGNAGSDLDYRRALGEVLAATDAGIFAAETQVDYGQMQIDAINNTADILTSMQDELTAYVDRLVNQGAFVERTLRRVEGEGWLIRTDSNEPVQVEVVS
ncbi:phage tail length tape measure family protein [Novosphingobium sp. KN65.2]|uniref:phage tail length tape measure family protein n=1 Tax=Novosphingobium sp. KN65.2 TaxID=1478134 RepID=UPI0005E91D4D|nr:phage tail length tape measure family protein [Novosphingobium sp. KN65.2]CDO34993.1 conserved hypothetical protein [Novosphingobium sp. KN65.2]